jgi:hypothetical protein
MIGPLTVPHQFGLVGCGDCSPSKMFQCLVDILDSLDSIIDLNNSRSAANVLEIGFQVRGFHGGALSDTKKPGFLVKPGF